MKERGDKKMENLEAIHDARASFYGKAKIEVTKNSVEQMIELYSYGTLVARIINNFIDKKIIYEYLGKYSCTTTRHQKEFYKQNGLNDNEIKNLFKNGKLEKEF